MGAAPRGRADGQTALARHGYALSLLVGALGAVGVIVGTARPWVSATAEVVGLPTIKATADGADLAPVAAALGVVLLAAFGAVVATRGWVRRGLGVLVVVLAVVVVVSVLHPADPSHRLTQNLSAKGWDGGPYQTATQAWRWLALVGALAAGAAGAAVAAYGGRWATMGRRYDAPQPDREHPAGRGATAAATGSAAVLDENATEAEIWNAIDQGRDPTQPS